MFWYGCLWSYYFHSLLPLIFKPPNPGVYITHLNFLNSHSQHSPEGTKLYTYFHIVRSTVFQLFPPTTPYLTEEMQCATTIPFFSYTSLPLQLDQFSLTFTVRLHVIPSSFLLPTCPLLDLIEYYLKLSINSYLQYCDKAKLVLDSYSQP